MANDTTAGINFLLSGKRYWLHIPRGRAVFLGLALLRGAEHPHRIDRSRVLTSGHPPHPRTPPQSWSSTYTACLYHRPRRKLRCPVARVAVERTRNLGLQLGDPPQSLSPQLGPLSSQPGRISEDLRPLPLGAAQASPRPGFAPSSVLLTFSAGFPRARLS